MSTAGIRAGEELNVQAVTTWLQAQGVSLTGNPVVTQFQGGASNWTYRLQYDNADLVLRRPPAGTKAKGAHDMGREFRIQNLLKPVYPAVPTLVAYCNNPEVLGCEFYVMVHVSGLIPRKHLPRGMKLTPAETRALCLSCWDKLIELHQVDVKASGLDVLHKGDGYTRRQVEGWSQRYEKAKTWNVSSFKAVRQWLHLNCPDDVKSCMIHNDWRLDNLIFSPDNPTQVVGVLDWELATVGDPLMDLGSALAYWVESGDGFLMKLLQRQPSSLPGMLTRREIVDYYLQKTGLKTSNWTFYEVFGLFRLAVIAQQIYYRYHHKQTRNPAFKHFWILVNYFDWRCKRLIARAATSPGQ
ncbi:phosphotransferase family protein [Limnobacter humi]|uniref:Phosphotransferase family protein n=1 Tax=Limnobacter humi TaxID=1778671 RepID=A0ABT1WDA0_9BURK|nr:phosphotransferase family protein [Limnobacter humi]MCQ8895501.1 phosphotransferase family protein [Limnobacter humi]